jgi:dTDP-4-amino-4,6-dideoxygalactose transaminase
MAGEKLALLGGEAAGVPAAAAWPRFSPAAIARVVELLERSETVTLGKRGVIEEAEAAVSAYHGGRHAMVVSSGHASLHAALMGLEIGPGDEVITTPYTWGASIACILHTGAVPIFVDVDPVTGLLDPARITSAITPRTKAILPVHIYGQPADMPAIRRVAQRHGLFVIEDGSQAHGAAIQGEKVGSFSDAAGFSCMGGKLLATSEAGYLVTPHADVYWKAAMMGQHYGRSADPGFPEAYKPYVDSLVFTYRLSPLIAALFPSQLAKLDGEVAARRENVARLRELLADVGWLQFPDYAPGFEPSYHMVTTNFVPAAAGVTRATALKALNAEGVGIFAYVPSPLSTWRRLQWQGYEGPVPFWLEGLRRAGIDYSAVALPNCEHKIAHALEMGWNYVTSDPEAMARLAAAFHKVDRHLGALRDWERRETGMVAAEPAAVAAAGRAARSYERAKQG